MFLEVKNDPIYRHDFVQKTKELDKLKNLMESSFSNEFARYEGNPMRKKIAEERKDFISYQFANRMRVAANTGDSALNEDAKIFAGFGGEKMKKLFESAAQGDIIGLGNVANPDSSSSYTNGIWDNGYKNGTGDLPSFVFGLQNHLALNCIGFDLMPTIACDTPKVQVNYVDTVYGGGVFDDVDVMPKIFNLDSYLFTKTFIGTTASLVRGTTELVIRAADGKFMTVVFYVAATAGRPSITVMFKNTGTSTAATGTITYVADNSVTVEEVVASVNAALTTSKVYWTAPTVEAGGQAFTSAQTLTANFTSAIRTNIAEATSNNNSTTGMDRKTHEKGPAFKLNVQSFSKQVEMKGIEIEADTTNIQIKDFAAMGINVISHLYTGVQNAIIQTLDTIILDHLYAMGVQNAYNTYIQSGKHFSLYIDNPTNASLSFADATLASTKYVDMTGNDRKSVMGTIPNSFVSSLMENQNSMGDRLFARILSCAEFIAQQNRLGVPDFIVLPGELAACIKKQSKYFACPVANTLSNSPELSYTGTINETINVYKNPRIDFYDTRILIGRRGDDKDPGAKFLAYDLAASRQTINPDTMAEKIRVWSRFCIADIGFLPELNYYTMVAVNKYGGWA